MAVISINKGNYDALVSENEKLLLDFYADWCGPCRMLSPIVEEIANEHPEFVIAKVNVDDEGELAMRFDVSSIPTLVVLKNGETVNRAMGVRPKAAVLSLLED